MRALALDIGDARIGVAASDLEGRIASPVKVLPAAEVLAGARTWRILLEDYDPEVLVFGLPVSLDGEENAQAGKVREQAGRIARAAGLPAEYRGQRRDRAWPQVQYSPQRSVQAWGLPSVRAWPLT